LRYDDVSYAHFLPQVVWRSEGSISFHDLLSIAHHGRIRNEADVIFNGHFGGPATGQALIPGQFLARNLHQLADFIVTNRAMLRMGTLRMLFKPSFLNDAYPEMARGVERSLLDRGESRLPLAYNLWNMSVRQRRHTFCSPAVDRYVIEQVTPFTDNDVVDCPLCMPIRYLFSQRAYKRMIVYTFPEIAGVPWTRTGRLIPTNFAGDIAVLAWLFTAKRLRRLRHHGKQALVDPRVRSLEPYALGDLAIDALPPELFDRDGVRRVGRAALEGSGSTVPLFLLTTLAECARLFCSSSVTEPPLETRPNL
jgi:hypothetical protein